VAYSGAEFIVGEGLFGRGSLIGEIEDESPFGFGKSVFWKWFICSPLTEEHQRFIDGYARHPGEKGRVFAKSSKVYESALKRPLDCVFRILSIAQYSEGSPIDPQSVTLVQFSECN